MTDKKTLAITLILALLCCFIVYRIYDNDKKEINALKQKNKELSLKIQRSYLKIDSLKLNVDISEQKFDSIVLSINQRNIEFQKTIKKYEKRKEDFYKLPNAIRDSLIMDFIRSNQ